MSQSPAIRVHNGHAFAVEQCSVLGVDAFGQAVLTEVAGGGQIAAMFGAPCDGKVQIIAVISHASEGELAVLSTLADREMPSLTNACPQAHLFEREILEQWGVAPLGHPWPKPVRFAPPLRAGNTSVAKESIGIADFFAMRGEEAHEVAVGPVHAGVIEPGHFRFQCHGESVHHLEISLGYQHRGVERALIGGPDLRTIHYMETLAGDTSVGHATAYCRAIEALTRSFVPARGQAIRGVAMELERIANHIGDLGAIAGDIGFAPTMSYCGRIRGDVLNMTGLICGNRFGRGTVRPGGACVDVDPAMAKELLSRLDAAQRDARGAIELLWNTASVLARFEGTGTVSREWAQQIGLVGVAARACGLERDVRCDLPYGLYRFAQIPLSTWDTGDVFARAYVRWMEVQRSFAFIREQLQSLPQGPVRSQVGPLAPRHMAATLVEGWRGQICHVAITDHDGKLARYKVVDPSFHNWLGLACALRGQQISDFPLCNKSFNLSYCGHDL